MRPALVCLGCVLFTLTAPAQQPAQPAQRGIIARISPDTGLIVLRLGNDKNVKDRQFQVDKKTLCFGSDGGMLGDGLKCAGFKIGAEVWFRLSPGNQSVTIVEIGLVAPPEAQPRRPD
jgi:hypothetical protein